MVKESNNLTHIITKQIGKEQTVIKIRLNDECKNGHQDFAITASVYKNGRDIMGGCCHDHILSLCPELKVFIDLHLCDYKGIPMHCVANGFYHLNEWRLTPEKFIEYYRITPEQYTTIKDSENQTHYAILLSELGILEQWEKEAKKAIKILEDYTGKTFKIDSVRTQYDAPDIKAVLEFKKQKKSGYFDLENVKARAKTAKKQKMIAKKQSIIDSCNNKINKEKAEKDIKLLVLKKIGYEFDNFIYYNHINTLTFNWNNGSYNKQLSKKAFDKFVSSITPNQLKKLPSGIKFELK